MRRQSSVRLSMGMRRRVRRRSFSRDNSLVCVGSVACGWCRRRDRRQHPHVQDALAGQSAQDVDEADLVAAPADERSSNGQASRNARQRIGMPSIIRAPTDADDRRAGSSAMSPKPLNTPRSHSGQPRSNRRTRRRSRLDVMRVGPRRRARPLRSTPRRTARHGDSTAGAPRDRGVVLGQGVPDGVRRQDKSASGIQQSGADAARHAALRV